MTSTTENHKQKTKKKFFNLS